ncbi:LTA synthase family protein [Sedimentibacter sp. zth1]|uniref:LTA synthase family protein n=1 Tax=Sedimentibacter sp. zth1 TaxID=2816908 RepID=UPI001A9301E3|nr:LTA synthase family protein [Sedimentibacter sp. zth1]QSX04910.1 LTA synthase family protein [Sedimentibacter sp. zth1]
MKKFINWIKDRHLAQSVMLSFAVYLVVEILSRRSIFLGLQYLIFNPMLFLFNMTIVLFTYYITCLFKRKYFTMLLVTIIWLGLGITNCVVLGFRTTPLGAIDFKIVKSALDIMPVYLNIFEMILIGVSIVATIILIVYAFIKLPRRRPAYNKLIPSCLIITVFTLVSSVFYKNMNIVPNSFKNIADAYSDYGFAYCFTCTLVDRGIDEPEDYSKEAMKVILSEIDEEEANKNKLSEKDSNNKVLEEDTEYKANTEHPNILFLQLESFFDVKHLKDVTFSSDPVPVFSHLKGTYSSGFLTVPTVGAGTANTEFEIITGMSLQFFGPGEYPYTTILKSSTCETINYNLKELGYKTQAIHNHKGGFYGRNEVYKQLGFDVFTPIEYMNNVEYNPLGWCKDCILTNQIIKSLKSTEQRDLVYTISVQGHGRYPSEVIDENQSITVEGVDEDVKVGFEYFVNQINEMDDFIGSLISTLENFDEPVVLVMFGDHLPAFDIKQEQLDNNSIFQTEYVIWDNIGLKQEDKDINAYQLTSNVMSKLNFDNGVLTRFHNVNSDNYNYLDKLQMLEHDMLYGDKIIYGGANPYEPTNLQMGINKIYISDISQIEDDIYVLGHNFTYWSEVYVNNKKKEAKYKDKNIIILQDIELEDGDIVTINQESDDWKILGKSDEFVYKIKTE